MTLAVEVDDLSFTYRGRERPALSHLSFYLRPGETLAALGHSGAGKSTLLAALAAVVPEIKKGRWSGRAAVFGRALAGLRPRDLAGRVACVFEDFDAALVATTVEQEVAFGPRYLGLPAAYIEKRVTAALASCGLADLRGRAVATLSGGQKQRLAVAAALAAEARLFLLDEAGTDLDPMGKKALAGIIAALRERGCTVIAADNDGAGALGFDGVLLLAGGEEAGRGAPAAVLGDAGLCARAGVAPLPYLRFFDAVETAPRLKAGVRGAAAAPHAEPAEGTGAPFITAEEVRFTYPNGGEALRGADLAVPAGDFLALVGQNGGGKTTLAKLLAGFMAPAAGAVRVGGAAPHAMPTALRARVVGYLFQNPDHQIFQATVAEEVAFGPRRLGLDDAATGRRMESALAAVGMSGRGDEDPFALPKGDRQRVALASVLAMEPEVLVLDEPTTGLDRGEVTSLMTAAAALNARGTTVIFITHALDVVASFARRVAVVADGRVLACDTTRRVLRDRDLLARAGLEPPLAARLAAAAGIDAITGDELERALAFGAGGGGL